MTQAKVGHTPGPWERSPLYNSNLPIQWLNGRPCQVAGATRVHAAKKGWGWRNIHSVRYLDGLQPSSEVWAAGKLNVALRRGVNLK